MKKALFAIVMFVVIAACDILVLNLNGAIDPPTVQYVVSGLQKAKMDDFNLVLIILDTPGGLLSSTKDITDAILNSAVPVAVFVHPDGARAASAGVFIMTAAHIAAMSPGTHIGAAHPVSIGFGSDTSRIMLEKVANDAVAWLRSMAQIRGRNQDWLERAVRYSESITAAEAESMNAIDIVAVDVEDLIRKIAELREKTGDTTRYPDVVHEKQVKLKMSIPQKFLHTILNPNIAYILLLMGLVGIYFELQNPGYILPGVVGVISLMSAIYAFQILPVNWVGILLIMAGIIMFILEVKMPGFGLLFSGGIIALLLGSFMLTSGNPPEFQISWSTIIPAIAFLVLFFIFVVAKAILIHKRQAYTGNEGLVGEIGEVTVEIPEMGKGKVQIHGELWNAKATKTIPKGAEVKVTKVDGMTIWVEPV